MKSVHAADSIVDVCVAPLVGAWIEIIISKAMKKADEVAPLVGAWIEIIRSRIGENMEESLLSWERGLKFAFNSGSSTDNGRSSRGSVD